MSETDIVTIGGSLPRIRSVTAHDAYSVTVTWNDGKRAVVDLAPLIFSMKFYAPLRDNPGLLKTVHIVEHGSAIAWGDGDEIDMPATSVHRIESETMTPHDFKAFMKRHNYTLDSVAAELGISRRQAAYYAKERAVPRYIALACRYLDAADKPDTLRTVSDELSNLKDHAAAMSIKEGLAQWYNPLHYVAETPSLNIYSDDVSERILAISERIRAMMDNLGSMEASEKAKEDFAKFLMERASQDPNWRPAHRNNKV